jgi:hypothetical protein
MNESEAERLDRQEQLPSSGSAAAATPARPAIAKGSPAEILDGKSGKIVRAILTSAVRDREPVDALVAGQPVSGGKVVYFFTELRDLAGKSVEHRWMHGERVVSSFRYTIGSDRWRLYSRMPSGAAHKGRWQAVVVDGDGAILAVAPFLVE